MDDFNQNHHRQSPKKTKLPGSSSNPNMQQQNSQARMMEGSSTTPNIQQQIPEGMMMSRFSSNPNLQQQNTLRAMMPGSSTTPAPLPLSMNNFSPNFMGNFNSNFKQQTPYMAMIPNSPSTPMPLSCLMDNVNPDYTNTFNPNYHQRNLKRMKLQDSSSTPALLPHSKNNLNPNFQQQISQRIMMPDSSSTPVTLPLSMESMFQTIVEKHTQEMDLYIQQQLDLLRRSIIGYTQQQLASTIQSLNSEGASIIREKDEEIARVKDKVQRLEECINIKEQNLQACKTEAKEKEAVALSLRNSLEQLKDKCFSSTRRTEGKGENELNPSEPIGSFRHCKVCGSHESCMLMLPCKHVCSCKLCDASLQSCPVCKCEKKSSVEIFFE